MSSDDENNKNVVNLFGGPVEGPPKDDTISVEEVYRKSQEYEYEKLVIIGISDDDNISVSTNLVTIAEMTYLLEKLKLALVMGEI